MTILQHDIRARERERAELDAKLSAYLSAGKMIEVLSTNGPSRTGTNFNNSNYKETQRGR